MKLLGCLCAVCAMAVVAAVGAGTVRAGAEIPHPPAPVLLGDADENGRLTVADAVLVLKVALGLRAPIMAANSVATINVTDANEDGIVTIADAQLVLREVLGLAKPRTIKWLPPTEPIEKAVFQYGAPSPVPLDAVPRFAGLPNREWAVANAHVSADGKFLGYLEDDFLILYAQGSELLLGGWGYLMYLNLSTGEKKVALWPVGGEAVFFLEGGILSVWSGEDAELSCIQFKKDSEGDYLAVKWRYKLPVWEVPHKEGEKVIIIEGGSWMVSPNIVLVRTEIVVREKTGWEIVTGRYERLIFCSVSSKGAEVIAELRLQLSEPDRCSWQYGVAFHQGYILLPLIKWGENIRTLWIPYDGARTEVMDIDPSITTYVFGGSVYAGGFWPDPDGSVWEGYDGNRHGGYAGAEKGVAKFRLQCVRE